MSNMIERDSQEVKNFYATLDEVQELVATTLHNRTPHFNGEKFLTNKDIAKLLHSNERTLQEYRNAGVISYIQISGGKVLYKESDILELLESNYTAAIG